MEFEHDAKFWKTIVDRMLAGVIITDISTKYLYVNDIFSTMTGYSKEELRSMKITDLAQQHSQLLAEGISYVASGSIFRGEIAYKTRSGKTRWAFGVFTPYTYKGKVYAVGNFIDITYDRELERKLKESEEFYRSLIDNSAAPIYIVQDGKFVFFNRMVEEKTGYTREELIGRNAFEIVYPGDREMVLKRYMEREVGLRDVDTYSFRVVAKDGRVRWFTMTARRIEYQGKPAVYVSGIETTEIMNLTEELRKKNEFFSLLSKILRHDILNDLAIVRASIEIRSDELLDKTLRRIDSIVEKIDDIRALEEAIGALKVLNVAELVKGIVEKYRGEANFRLNLQEVHVEANEALKSAVENLISNAIIHSQVSPVEVEVEVFREKEDCVIRIADNGVGIPEELKDRIFDAKYSRKGGGLGLFLVKKIVEMFNGGVQVYDNKPQGVVFEIRIPAKFM
ncbi:MAG: PAS domain S-box protein [Archaeoglobaceae archaeon]